MNKVDQYRELKDVSSCGTDNVGNISCNRSSERPRITEYIRKKEKKKAYESSSGCNIPKVKLNSVPIGTSRVSSFTLFIRGYLSIGNLGGHMESQKSRFPLSAPQIVARMLWADMIPAISQPWRAYDYIWLIAASSWILPFLFNLQAPFLQAPILELQPSANILRPPRRALNYLKVKPLHTVIKAPIFKWMLWLLVCSFFLVSWAFWQARPQGLRQLIHHGIRSISREWLTTVLDAL